MGWDKYTNWGAGKGSGQKYVPPTKEQSDEIRKIIKQNQKKASKGASNEDQFTKDNNNVV